MAQRAHILDQLVATCFGIGYCPVASGTAASIAGMGLIYALLPYPTLYLPVLIGLLVLGTVTAGRLARAIDAKDPGIVVIDEVVGLMIAMIGIPWTWPNVICGFFLFRALDMFKIYPINKFEALPGGVGIMLDDVMAGLYTNVILNVAMVVAINL